VIGGLAWVLSMTLGGYLLGRAVPNIDRNIHYVIAIVIAVSLRPPVIAWLRSRLAHKPFPHRPPDTP
jgi:membrane-associated protein